MGGLKGALSALRADCSGDQGSPGGWLNDVRKSRALAQPIRNRRFLRTADDVRTVVRKTATPSFVITRELRSLERQRSEDRSEVVRKTAGLP